MVESWTNVAISRRFSCSSPVFFWRWPYLETRCSTALSLWKRLLSAESSLLGLHSLAPCIDSIRVKFEDPISNCRNLQNPDAVYSRHMHNMYIYMCMYLFIHVFCYLKYYWFIHVFIYYIIYIIVGVYMCIHIYIYIIYSITKHYSELVR